MLHGLMQLYKTISMATALFFTVDSMIVEYAISVTHIVSHVMGQIKITATLVSGSTTYGIKHHTFAKKLVH